MQEQLALCGIPYANLSNRRGSWEKTILATLPMRVFTDSSQTRRVTDIISAIFGPISRLHDSISGRVNPTQCFSSSSTERAASFTSAGAMHLSYVLVPQDCSWEVDCFQNLAFYLCLPVFEKRRGTLLSRHWIQAFDIPALSRVRESFAKMLLRSRKNIR